MSQNTSPNAWHKRIEALVAIALSRRTGAVPPPGTPLATVTIPFLVSNPAWISPFTGTVFLTGFGGGGAGAMGGAAANNQGGGGGGASEENLQEVQVVQGNSYAVVIGAGGIAGGAAAGDTTFSLGGVKLAEWAGAAPGQSPPNVAGFQGTGGSRNRFDSLAGPANGDLGGLNAGLAGYGGFTNSTVAPNPAGHVSQNGLFAGGAPGANGVGGTPGTGGAGGGGGPRGAGANGGPGANGPGGAGGAGLNAAPNTGAGGGGGGGQSSVGGAPGVPGNGGSGLLILRYLTT
jgi:hypothetical protein